MSGRRQPIRRESISPSTAISPAISDFHRRAATNSITRLRYPISWPSICPKSQSFKAGKVVYNCLLADLYPGGRRPVKGSFDNGWPAEIQQRVRSNWHKYGYR
ncbi:hypothetical protein IU429_19530 [Nocardia elegans]|uniref:Uncharacterized protein n=1 Tax=Nocardia elegans TaxID=300029 RepID=A0ABW6TG11_9NOCA|nr:hypothetical protein [Nocardia elegans]MBF6449869.1 hypothetical protein [Nocardia elegans]